MSQQFKGSNSINLSKAFSWLPNIVMDGTVNLCFHFISMPADCDFLIKYLDTGMASYLSVVNTNKPPHDTCHRELSHSNMMNDVLFHIL